uniref:GYF domain containing protein, putative n=1 Tax=Theileria annulata TaxID=5874 RepID=A0A3B0MWL2_THEAN
MFNPRPSSGISHSFSKSSSKLDNTNKLETHPHSNLETQSTLEHSQETQFHNSKFKSNSKDLYNKDLQNFRDLNNFRDFSISRDLNNLRDYGLNYDSGMDKSNNELSKERRDMDNSIADMSMEMLFGSNKNVLELSSDGVFEKNYLLRLMFTFDRMPRLGNRRSGSETLRFHSVDISVGREQENFYDKSDKMKKLLYKPLSKRFLPPNVDSKLLETKFMDTRLDSGLVDTKFMDSKYMNSRLMDQKLVDNRIMDEKLLKGVRNLGIKPMLHGEDNNETDKEFQTFNMHNTTNSANSVSLSNGTGGSGMGLDMVRHFSRESASHDFTHFSKINSHGFNSDHKLSRTFFNRESNDQSFTRQYSNRESNDQSFTRQYSNRETSTGVPLTRQFSNRESGTDVKLTNLTNSLVQGLNTDTLPRSSSLNTFNLNNSLLDTKSGFDTKSSFDKSGFEKSFDKSGFEKSFDKSFEKSGFEKSFEKTGFEVTDYMLRDKKSEGSKSFLEKLLDKPFETQSHSTATPTTTTTTNTTTTTSSKDVELDKDKLSPEPVKTLPTTNPLSMERLSSDRLGTERLGVDRLINSERMGKEPTYDGMKYWNEMNLQWQYMDPQGMVHGPFSSDQMYHWYVKNFFHQNLRMRFNTKMPWMPFKELFSPNSIPFKSLPKLFLQTPNLPPMTMPNSNLNTNLLGPFTNSSSGLMGSGSGLMGSNSGLMGTNASNSGFNSLMSNTGLMNNNASLLSSNTGLMSNASGMSKSMDNVWNSNQSTVYPITSMGNIHISTPKLSINQLKQSTPPTQILKDKELTSTTQLTKDLTATTQFSGKELSSKEFTRDSKELMSDKELTETTRMSSTEQLTATSQLTGSREMSKVEKRWNTTTVEVSSLMEIMELEKKSAKERSVKSPPKPPQTGWNMSDLAPNNFSESDDFPSLATTADTTSAKSSKENLGKKFGKQITMPLETFIEKHPIQPPHLTESFSSKLLGNKH